MSGIEEMAEIDFYTMYPGDGPCVYPVIEAQGEWMRRETGEAILNELEAVKAELEQYKRDAERMRLLEGLLSDAKDLIERGDFSEGYCMCGDPVDWHGLGYGHAPTDAGEYCAAQLVGNIDAALNQQPAEGE